MKEKAAEIGAKNTHFTSPNGLHDPNHYTTVYDMALIAKEAMKHPFVMEVMGTKTKNIQTSKQKQEITNPSKIHDNPLAIGGKTGYTNAAQNTLVEILQKGNKQVIAVVMKSTLAEEYNDIQIMGDVAFSAMNDYKKVVNKGDIASTKTIEKTEMNYLVSEDVYAEVEKGKKQEITTKIKAYDLEEKEVKKGDVIGQMTVLNQGKIIKKVDLLADGDVTITEHIEASSNESDTVSILNIFISILLPILFYVGFAIFYNVRKQREVKIGKD